MTSRDGLVRIFWPFTYIRPDTQGILVGFRNSDADFFVTSILTDTEIRVVENALRVGILFRDSPHEIKDLLKICGSDLHVLGIVNPRAILSASAKSLLVAYTRQRSRMPKIFLADGAQAMAQLILYSPPQPDRMQYFSLEPISLSLEQNNFYMGYALSPTEEIEAKLRQLQLDKVSLVEKMRLHTIIKHPPKQKELALDLIVKQMNSAHEIDSLMQKNLGYVRSRSRRTLSVSEKVVESATDLWDFIGSASWHFYNDIAWPVISAVFIRALMANRMMGEVILIVVGWEIGKTGFALKDVSATAQQVDLRLQQFCYWPIQYLMLRERKDNWESITNKHSEYIRFYNSLWLVANDVIMGIALGSFIIENTDAVAYYLSALMDSWSLDGLRRLIAWLMVYPGGLKLNNELAEFLGDLFLWVINYWAEIMSLLQPTFPVIIRFVGYASFAGASMPLSLCSDLVSILTLHIHCFYVASARIYNWQLTIIISLFHLFRGKKRNVLRNRIDSCDYELDQLLLGTILFTLLFFLLPTVAVFYFSFALSRTAIIFLKAVLDTMLACLNHFPLFAMMLRAKDSRRLPGGINFLLRPTPSEYRTSNDGSLSTSYIIVQSTPLSVRAIFHEYFAFGHRIRKHYIALHVVLDLITGGFIPPLRRKNLYDLQYSMLPSRRVGIAELWRRLSGEALVNGPGGPPGHGKRVSVNMNGHVKRGSGGQSVSRRSSKERMRH